MHKFAYPKGSIALQVLIISMQFIIYLSNCVYYV